MNTNYENFLNELKEQILKDGNTLVSKRDLLKRFCEIDKEYNGDSWNLLQILANIHILIGEEPCEDAISREDVIKEVDHHTFDTEDGLCLDEDISIIIEKLPSVTPTRKKGKWIDTTEIGINTRGQILHEVICSKCNGISYFRSIGNKYIGANLCPNCGSRNEV
jgi:hypothetical protein